MLQFKTLAGALLACMLLGVARAAPATCDPRVLHALDALNERREAPLPPSRAGDFPADMPMYSAPAMVYWFARAGCAQRAEQLVASAGGPSGGLYAVAGAMIASGQVDEAGYRAVIDSRSRDLLADLLLLLASPGQEPWLERYLGEPSRDRNERLERVFKLLHGQRRHAEAIRWVARFGPLNTGTDIWPTLMLAGSHLATGDVERGMALAKPYMNNFGAASPFANSLASFGQVREAWALADTFSGEARSRMVFDIAEASGDLAGAAQRVSSPCDRAWLAAMHRRYLEAMQLADEGRCEKVRLTEIAARHRDELLFGRLAAKAGVQDSPGWKPQLSMVMSLIAWRRSDLAQLLFVENGLGDNLHLFSWNQIARLAGPEFRFDAWLPLYLAWDRKQGAVEPLVNLASAHAHRRPDDAIAWHAAHAAQLTPLQDAAFEFGLVRGLLGLRPSGDYGDLDEYTRAGKLYDAPR